MAANASRFTIISLTKEAVSGIASGGQPTMTSAGLVIFFLIALVVTKGIVVTVANAQWPRRPASSLNPDRPDAMRSAALGHLPASGCRICQHPECGGANRPHAKYCGNCGRILRVYDD